MLLKTVDGNGVRMLHDGRWYEFRKNETKECPDTMLSAYRGVLISAEPPRMIEPIVPTNPTMKLIDAEPKEKITVKVVKNTKKKTKSRRKQYEVQRAIKRRRE